jgi:glycosyltransferase involved in cell wall biosynthesis
VDDLEEAVHAAERIPMVSRWRCRQRFEERFSASRIARDYLALYQRLMKGALVHHLGRSYTKDQRVASHVA